MKALALLLCLTACTTNQLRAAYHVSNLADGMQTERGLDNGCTEANWIAGEHPSDAKLAGLVLVQSGIAEAICGHAGDSERFCWGAFLGVKILAVGWNATQHCQ